MIIRRLSAVVMGVLFALSWSTAALAHAVLEPANAPAGEATSFQLLIPHGCAPGEPPPPEGTEVSDTRLVSMEIPEGMTVMDAQDYNDMTAEVTDTEVTWSGGTLADGDAGELTFTAMLDGADGDEITVNVYQECTDDLNYRWTGSADEATPAPVLTVGSEAAEGGHDHSDPAQHADGQAHDPDEESEPHDHADPAQHADCMPHDPGTESESVPAGEVDCTEAELAQAEGEASEEPAADEAATEEPAADEAATEEPAADEGVADEATEEPAADEGAADDGDAPAGGPATGQGGAADGGLPVVVTVIGLAGIAGVALIGLRRIRA